MTRSQKEKSRIVLIFNTDSPANDIEKALEGNFEIYRIDTRRELLVIPENTELIITIVQKQDNYSELYDLIRKIGNNYIPILLVTSTHPQKIMSFIDDFITTPIDWLELHTRVLSLMRIKKLHETLIRERDQAQTYIDAANCVVCVLDKNMNIVLANRETSEVLGYSQKELIGQNWFDICLPERGREYIKEGYVQMLEGKQDPPEFSEKPIITRDGNERLMLWHDVVLRDDNNQIIGIISSGEDITTRKQVEEALTQANQELCVLDKMKNDFMANLSRELRTPIVSIKGFCELLKSEEIGNLNNKQKKAIETIIKSSEKLHNLIDSLLYTSDELVEQVNYNFCPIRIQDIMKKIIPDMEALALKKNITLKNEIAPLPAIWGDETHLKILFSHLLDNAIKFTPENG